VKAPPHDVTGRGDPLLFLSGYAVPAAALDVVKAPFSSHFSCITFDYPGSGVARPPVLPLTIPSLAASAVCLLDHLGLESAHVYGMSMGGLVAQEMAIRFPERVRGLVLGATTPGGPNARRTDPWTFVSAMSSIKSQVDGAHKVRISGMLYQGYAAMLHDSSTRLDQIQARTLIIHGERDVLVPVANACLLHEKIPRSSLTVLPGASHSYAFDDPSSSAAVVLEWFQRSKPFPPGQRSWLRRSLEPYNRTMAIPLGYARAISSAGRRTMRPVSSRLDQGR
jgi:3-oxoadipate enol-lactonase